MIQLMTRKEVLKCFKNIHRARKAVFAGDEFALNQSRQKINEEFLKNKQLSDTNAIQELLKYCREVEHELRTNVIQVKKVESGKYRVNIRPETTKLENVPFKDTPCTKN